MRVPSKRKHILSDFVRSTGERVQNARHKNVTSAVNTTFFKVDYKFILCMPTLVQQQNYIN